MMAQLTRSALLFLLFACKSFAFETSTWSKAGKVVVRVEKELPCVRDPLIAADAWIEHHWIKGGGLPIFSIQKQDPNVRVIAPIMMEETLTRVEDNGDSGGEVLEYTVTDPGPAFADVVAGSHQGRVSFIPLESGQGCKMEWNVEFETRQLQKLYQKVTEFTIGTAARTVAEAVSSPRILTLDATLEGVADPIEARKGWLEFIWTGRGGGLPLLPPIPRGDVLPEGGGTARKALLRIPPWITEEIVSTSESPDDSFVDLLYQMKRPGWTSLPFLMHTHQGCVVFSESEQPNSVDIHWKIEIRPYMLVDPLVEILTEMTVCTLLRNLAVHFSEPGAKVDIKPPRGNAKLSGGIEALGSVDKDTWLGGVLYAHLRDNRSTMEQTLSIFQPWTWGRSSSVDDSDESIRYSWSRKE